MWFKDCTYIKNVAHSSNFSWGRDVLDHICMKWALCENSWSAGGLFYWKDKILAGEVDILQ
jgi:hypothetical protein